MTDEDDVWSLRDAQNFRRNLNILQQMLGIMSYQ